MKTGTFLLGAGAVTAAGIAIWYFTRGPRLPCGPHGYGDINDDGVVNMEDVTLATLIKDGYIEPTLDELMRADVDGDGEVTWADVALIEHFVLGDINTFPVC